MTSLLARWTGRGYAVQLGERLLARYWEGHRRYHTSTHLEQAFAVLDDDLQAREAFARLPEIDREAVELAIWYHDAVYDPRAGDDEERSAALFELDAPALGAQAALCERVRQLILASTIHRAQDDVARLFCDLDLSILGSDAASYHRYREAVRKEYAHLADKAWQAGRAAVLTGFLARPRIFHVLSGREEQAFENLRAELDDLLGSS